MKRARRLSDLAQIKRELQEAARREALAREQAEREQRERHLFAHAVGPVMPLRPSHRAVLAREPASPIPRQRERDEAAVLRESISDEFDVETLLDTDDSLSFRRPQIAPDVLRKLRRGVWAVQDEIDLHGLRREDARTQLAAFLRDALQRGLRCVRVVHGKGHGSPGREPVLKGKVRTWLVQRADVIAFVQARASQGGSGALIVLLQPTDTRPRR